ncbi:AGE family epimerase/isomerase [Bordetella holmesii]|uniref:N-acylglucosamine 2-epimerase n=2 Tax=Bordetella holmesii TaxID=35814 RepID=A0A158MB52_9BORD|nr:AGE family epimerase/isomerase [Bordetella holmesii]AHV93915.1 N-acylglucosamine 2-epimerase family protein [Bordetella holmesii ATCC 51541]AIT27414.1 N-acylglucosamine 2-epimerase family protein [Bordetella holmesii 44057]EWM42313.1 N-acylglucosamine 2-epimerase family protein [Bordetella holmesii 41130]EWM48007.1 N-acylglucosamine 2-epimerase family protein [Bordetella holmesii 35009]EWM48985.1 N-acylglucosamine 2-epimerase family protein [Bordetella holmesii 70147]
MSESDFADIQSLLRQHYSNVVLPLWLSAGFNPELGLPYEAVDDTSARPLPVARYRAMACARQIFIYSRDPHGHAHASRLFDALLRIFRNPAGGWYYSVDAAGEPLDTTQDLYTHAFIVLACAVYFERTRHSEAHKVLLSTVRDIEARFRDEQGCYIAARSSEGEIVRGREQNPVMHLTEAYLAAAALAEPAWFAQKLRELAQQVFDVYVDADTHCILELARDEPDNRIEPGHQFEWYALLASAPDVFDGLDLAALVGRAATWAEAHGVAAHTCGVHACLALDGSVIDGQQRIWAQTEYARYLALVASPDRLRQLQALRGRFLHAAGWHEVLSPEGEVLRRDMPSTTPYHLWTGYVSVIGG